MKSGYKRHFGSVAIFTVALWLSLAALTALAQQVVDKSIATVNDGVRTELITLSDLRWQLALQPNTPINPPSSQDLNQALQTLINQRLFALEAERLPRTAPTDAEINAEIANILSHFPSTAEFEKRLNTVGFSSVKDPNFERIVADRVAIEKYLDFRFRSFIVITPDDEAKYYRDVFVPEFRRKYPGSLMPTLDEKRAEINKILTENKVAADIETFLDEAKRRAEIVVLNEV
jgi:hypothetical protein